MITTENRKEAMEFLRSDWGWSEDAERVIAECEKINSRPMTFKEFLTHCTACGGNWGGMFLTGIRELYPSVYDAIPDDMGICPMGCIMDTLKLCNIDGPESGDAE